MKLIGSLIVTGVLIGNLAIFSHQTRIEVFVSEAQYPSETTKYNTSTLEMAYTNNSEKFTTELSERLQQLCTLNTQHYDRYKQLKKTLNSSEFSKKVKITFDIDEASNEEWVPLDSTKLIYPISKIIILLG